MLVSEKSQLFDSRWALNGESSMFNNVYYIPIATHALLSASYEFLGVFPSLYEEIEQTLESNGFLCFN